MKITKINRINPVAREMLQQRKSPQIVESKKIYDRNKKELKKIVQQKLGKCLNNATLHKTFEKSYWRIKKSFKNSCKTS